MAKAAAARTENREAFAAKPETTGKVKATAPQTGAEYLASLSDGRSRSAKNAPAATATRISNGNILRSFTQSPNVV